MSSRRRVLFVQTSFRPPGGGQAVAAWMLEALTDQYDVTVLTGEKPDWVAIDRFFGTALASSRLTIRPVLFRTFRLIGRVPLPLALLKDTLVRRSAQRLGHDYDVLVTANNETDFGRPGIQYIHYPWNSRPRPAVELRWYHLRPVLSLYYRMVDSIAPSSEDGVRNNLTLVNSDWTGALVTRHYGISTRTLYPPVLARVPAVPWAGRENGFVCIGRISPEKEIDRVIDVMAAVRRAAPDVRLHLVGTPTPGLRRYYRHIADRVKRNEGWIELHTDLSRAELLRLMSSQRYGIHGMLEEHFGIAPAEMAVAGCIVWVPRGGGQVEIVRGDPRLTYANIEEAADKIVRVIRNPDEQALIRASLADARDRFSTERFVRELRNLVDGFPS